MKKIKLENRDVVLNPGDYVRLTWHCHNDFTETTYTNTYQIIKNQIINAPELIKGEK